MLKNVKRTKQDNKSYSCVKETAQVTWKSWERTQNWHWAPLLNHFDVVFYFFLKTWEMEILQSLSENPRKLNYPLRWEPSPQIPQLKPTWTQHLIISDPKTNHCYL